MTFDLLYLQKSYKSIQEERSHIDLCLNFLQRIVIICPNFFPHLYNIQREEVLTKTEGAFEEIFKHLTNEKLGAGSHSTIVYKGDFGQRPIAIKKVSKATTNSVDQEISIMLKIDRHPNILRFFAKEEDENFIYIGMELCDYNLETFIKDQNLRKEMTNKTILQQTAEGLNHLHHLKIRKY